MPNSRQKILEYIIEQRNSTVDELSKVFRVTPANIRHHLSILIHQGSVKVIGIQARGEKGRPAQVYAPHSQGEQNNLDLLSDALLSTLQHISSDKGHDVLLREIAERLAARSQINTTNPTKRLYAAVQYLNQMQYQAHWEAHFEHPRIIFDNCPYRSIIDQHPEICRIDSILLEYLLTGSIRQTEKLSLKDNGLPQCVFIIRPLSVGSQ